jgi:hypothetical protein
MLFRYFFSLSASDFLPVIGGILFVILVLFTGRGHFLDVPSSIVVGWGVMMCTMWGWKV